VQRILQTEVYFWTKGVVYAHPQHLATSPFPSLPLSSPLITAAEATTAATARRELRHRMAVLLASTPLPLLGPLWGRVLLEDGWSEQGPAPPPAELSGAMS